MTTDATLGQPWHGKLTPSGLVLADASVKTSMQGTDAAGAPKTFSYVWSGDAFMGDTLYIKQPGLPEPTTPAGLAAIGGEFMNDAVLFGTLRRYSPFCAANGLNLLSWLHYGADGVWRRMSITRTVDSPTQLTVTVRRRGRFATIGGSASENTVIATLTLTTDMASSAAAADVAVPSIDARFDGRQILITRWGTFANPSDPLLGHAPWDSAAHVAIAGVWRIDIPATCDSATATRLWQRQPDAYSDSFDRTYLVSQGVTYTGGPYPTPWHYWEDFEGVRQASPDTHASFTRLLLAAFTPAGDVALIAYAYNNDYTGSSRIVRGRMDCGTGVSVNPEPPSARPPITDVSLWAPVYPGETIIEQLPAGPEYTISLQRNGVTAAEFSTPGAAPRYGKRVTNNVTSLGDDAVSIARIGPDVIDVSPSSFSPLYASYNPRTSTVHTSAAPIGFV